MTMLGRDTTPTLSVVVVVLVGPTNVRRALETLARQAADGDVEVLVPCDDRFGDLTALRRDFPGVRFLPAAGRRTYAELRAMAVRESRGRIVALTEDHCTAEPDWCARIVLAHRAPHAAIGGALEKRDGTSLSWAIYLADFGRYMNPVPEGPAPYLTDCNVSYKRDRLDAIANVWADEFHETAVNWALLSRRETLWLSPHIVVGQQRSLSVREAARDRYAFGRLFASTRVASSTTRSRVVHAILSCLLPPLLVARVARTVLHRRRHRRRFLRALPWLAVMTTIWAWGEFVGYLTGTPERSLAVATAPDHAGAPA